MNRLTKEWRHLHVRLATTPGAMVLWNAQSLSCRAAFVAWLIVVLASAMLCSYRHMGQGITFGVAAAGAAGVLLAVAAPWFRNRHGPIVRIRPDAAVLELPRRGIALRFDRIEELYVRMHRYEGCQLCARLTEASDGDTLIPLFATSARAESASAKAWTEVRELAETLAELTGLLLVVNEMIAGGGPEQETMERQGQASRLPDQQPAKTTLNVCGQHRITNPTHNDIRAGLGGLDKENNDAFAILELTDMIYIQTCGDRSTGFSLEHQEGSLDQHFRTTQDDIPLEQVIAAFIAFRDGKADWQKDFTFVAM